MPAPRGPGRLAIVGLIVLGVLVVVPAEWVLFHYTFDPGYGGDPALRVLMDASVGVAFLASGLVAWVARPASRTGPLMILTGLLYFIHNASWTTIPHLVYAAIGFAGTWFVLLAIVVMSYPTGRFVRRDERGLAVIALAWSIGAGLFMAVTWDVRGCTTCMPNPFFAGLPFTTDDLDAIAPFVETALLACFFWFLIRRRRRASPPERRLLAPVWLAGIVIAVDRLWDTVFAAVADPTAQWIVGWLINDPLTMVVPVALAWGLIRGRMDQASVGDLVVELGDGPPDAGWQAAIARALGDPGVVIATDGRTGTAPLVGLDGRAVRTEGRAVTPIATGPGGRAYLVHDPSLEANPGLVRAVAAATRLALDNQRLAAEVEQNLDEVRASRMRIVEASDAERARLERNLHDGAQQRLVTLGLQLRTRAELSADPDERVAYARLADDLDGALEELRELARGLHPTAVTQAGLAGAVEGLADRCPVPVTMDIPDRRYPPPVEVAAWFVIAEAVTNAVRHARATTISVRAVPGVDALDIAVQDDGVGGAWPAAGSGLAGLADRVAALGGRLEVVSPVGLGTTVSATLPLALT